MGHYEDLYYQILDDVNSKGLKKEFDAQLEKMNGQEKHRYKDTRDKWSYAHDKVTRLNGKKAKK